MLQILGKNTEAKFFCRKEGPEARKFGEVKFFWILEDLGFGLLAAKPNGPIMGLLLGPHPQNTGAMWGL